MAILKGNSAADPARHAIALDLGDLRSQGELVVAHAKKRAEQIVAEARAERERLLGGAAAEGFAAGMAKGTAEGLRQGREQGVQAAMAERRAALDGLEGAWLALANEILTERQGVLAEAGRNVVSLAIAIAERIVRRTVAAEPACVVDQVEAALKLVMRPTRVVIRINPADRPLVCEALPRLTERLAEGVNLELMDDGAMGRGSCGLRMTDSFGGTVDASLETQLDRIGEALVPPKAGKNVGAAESAGPVAGGKP